VDASWNQDIFPKLLRSELAQELNPLAEPGHEDFFGGRPVERVREARLVGDTGDMFSFDVLFESLW
jgi:hypothetical protein